MPFTAGRKGRSQTSITWWHFRFLRELSRHPQPARCTLDPRPSTPHFPASTPTTNSIHPDAPNWLCLKPMRRFLRDCIRHWLRQFLPSKTVGPTWLICLPLRQRSLCWVYPAPARIPGDFSGAWVCVASCEPRSAAVALQSSGRKMREENEQRDSLL